jgi:hypothetical protein
VQGGHFLPFSSTQKQKKMSDTLLSTYKGKKPAGLSDTVSDTENQHWRGFPAISGKNVLRAQCVGCVFFFGAQ